VAVSRDQVLAIAALARLRLDADEADTFARQLSDILQHVDSLGQAETADAGDDATAAHVLLRTDVPSADPLHRAPHLFAPAWADGFFTVPRLAALDDDANASRP
jgi:aspartyl-tRNA(Asn)/glutamyl-tRNA(Gln) amidotransferase subunit C